jgi:predicted nucleic acid-binding protein
MLASAPANHSIQSAMEPVTSIIVAAELRYGAAKKGSLRLTRQLEAVLGAVDVLALEAPTDAAYGELRARLEEAGKLIGANDLLIAAHALALDHTLVTDNEREFLTDRRSSSRKLVALTLVVCGEAGTQQKNSDVDSIRQIRSAIDPSRPFTAILRYSAARHWSACANLRLLDRLEHIFPAFRRSANRAKTCRQRGLISGAR